MKDKEVERKLRKIPDVDKNGDPIYKIADIKNPSDKKKEDKNKRVMTR